MNVRVALLSLLLICVAQAQEAAPPRADAIFIHGNIYTGVVDKAAFNAIKRAQAVAVRGDRIQAVGENAEILKLKGPNTQVIELGGKFVMAGFNDAHAHLSEGGFQALHVNLVGTRSLDEFRERIRANVASAAPGAWILGGGWDENLWPVKTVPTRWDVDEVSAGHPVFLERVDGHIAVANTRALQLASITIASRDPKGGKIDRDANGQPTGILRETARQAITDAIPPPTHDERRAAMERALAEAARWGVTSVQDNSGDWDDFHVLEEIEKDGKLTTRISEWLPFNDSVAQLENKRKSHPALDPMLHTGMLKGFMDGSLGSHTAALIEPYADDAKNSGLPRYDAPKLNEMTKERVLAGFQVGFHAIGDKGAQMALDAFAEAEKAAKEKKVKAANGSEDYRLRIEHAQVVTPLQVVKFRDLKVIASMQPCHLLSDMKWAQARLGEKRAAHSYAWYEFLKRGVTLAFGTDYPVESISPFRGLYAATTRKSEDGKQEYFPEQKISMDQAIAAYTSGSAFAEFDEKQKGLIVPGMFADFVVLDRDVTAVVPQKLLDSHVVRTVVGGKTVYEAK